MPAPNIRHVVVAIAAVIVFIATFLPWVTADAGIISVSQNGIDAEDGYISLIASLVALVAVAVALYGRPQLGGVLVALCGIVSTAVGIWDWIDVLDFAAGVDHSVSVGIGIVLTAIGGVVLAVFGAAIAVVDRSER